MYHYDNFDAAFVAARVEQFRDQVARRLSGELTEEQFRPHRLMNGLYLQLHSYMLRVAVPYGVLSSRQMRKLAEIARRYDRGYGHFTTRQNIQYNWPALKDTPDILAELASVEMHAIQTSGNCIRNVTADHFSGVAHDEIADPRPYAEILRQWSSLHPEFSFLPRKFKIAVNGATHDRAVIQAHDIGLQVVRNDAGEIGFSVYVGGGLGRTPMIGRKIRDFLPERRPARLRRSDPARLQSRRPARQQVQGAHQDPRPREGRRGSQRGGRGRIRRPRPQGARPAGARKSSASAHIFALPELEPKRPASDRVERRKGKDARFASFCASNVDAAQGAGLCRRHCLAEADRRRRPATPAPTRWTLSPISPRTTPTTRCASRTSRTSSCPMSRSTTCRRSTTAWRRSGLSTANAGWSPTSSPAPASTTARSRPRARFPSPKRIAQRFGDGPRARSIGPLKIKISGCINACGHHHVGHIGILGLERAGEETYQITLGGSGDEQAAIGQIIGPGFSSENVVEAIETVVETYIGLRRDDGGNLSRRISAGRHGAVQGGAL